MKTLPARANLSGLTLIELVVVVGVIVLVAALLLPGRYPQKQRATMIACMSNQRQIALAFIMWGDDHGGKFPWQIPGTNDGTMESSEKGEVASNYSALLAYVHQARIFVCPTDDKRTVAPDQANVSNQNVSYFVGLDVISNAATGILTGDRHLNAGQAPVGSGLFIYSNGVKMNWTRELHGNNPHSPMGAMSFKDGHAAVEYGTNTDFVFQNEELATSRFDIP